MRCSIEATSLRVNTAASGLIETESIPALTRNSKLRMDYKIFQHKCLLSS